MRLTAEHDGRLVADIVAEWADIHGQPFELVLEGPAGGKFSQGIDGERVEIDAIDFIRTLSGRLPGTGVLSHPLRLAPLAQGGTTMETRVDEIADRIYRLSTFVPDIGPTGFTFNQFLIDADEPAIFHTGPRAHVPVGVGGDRFRDAARTAALDHLRPSRSRRVRRDESVPRRGAPRPGRPHRDRAAWCRSTTSPTDRRCRIAPDGSYDLGGRRIRSIDTPHVPHGWDAHVLYEETTGTLFCGDLLSQVGDGPALTTDDLFEAAAKTEDMFGATCLTPHTAPTIRRLAELEPAPSPSCTARRTRVTPQGAARSRRRVRPPPGQRRLSP